MQHWSRDHYWSSLGTWRTVFLEETANQQTLLPFKRSQTINLTAIRNPVFPWQTNLGFISRMDKRNLRVCVFDLFLISAIQKSILGINHFMCPRCLIKRGFQFYSNILANCNRKHHALSHTVKVTVRKREDGSIQYLALSQYTFVLRERKRAICLWDQSRCNLYLSQQRFC